MLPSLHEIIVSDNPIVAIDEVYRAIRDFINMHIRSKIVVLRWCRNLTKEQAWSEYRGIVISEQHIFWQKWINTLQAQLHDEYYERFGDILYNLTAFDYWREIESLFKQKWDSMKIRPKYL
jgi:hypothetical protein